MRANAEEKKEMVYRLHANVNAFGWNVRDLTPWGCMQETTYTKIACQIKCAPILKGH